MAHGCKQAGAAVFTVATPDGRAAGTAVIAPVSLSGAELAGVNVGPKTKTVRDNALLYGIISGRDECDSTTVDVPAVELPEAEDLNGLRVGVPKELN